MKISKAVRGAITSLDFTRLERAIKGIGPNAELFSAIITTVKRTGCLLVRHEDPARKDRRKQFATDLGVWLLSHDAHREWDALMDHLRNALLCEHAFAEILCTLAVTPTGRAAPSVAAWSTLRVAAIDIAKVCEAASTYEAPLVGEKLRFYSPEVVRVQALGRSDLDPDGIFEAYALNLGSYLKMLGYRHGWFEDGVLRVPAFESTPESLGDDRSTIYLAEAWNRLDEHWDRIRHLSSSSAILTKRTYPASQGEREIDTLAFEHDWKVLRDIAIARARLRRKVFEVATNLSRFEYVNGEFAFIKDPTQTNVALAPKEFVSRFEVITMDALDMCYGLPLDRDRNKYLDLTLAEWVRGYALLQLCASRRLAMSPVGTDGLFALDLKEFIAIGRRAGVKKVKIQHFIRQLTFGRNSRDLFDAPIIVTAENQRILLPSLVEHIAIPEVLTSRLNSLLVQTDLKGPRFKKEVLDVFTQLGAEAKKLKYRNQEGRFDCDVAALWEDHLFLIECKAVTLPYGAAATVESFAAKQQEAVDQISRVARHLDEDPSLFAGAFGPLRTVSRTVCCVINLAPYCIPGTDSTVKIYDYGALCKFLDGGIKAVVGGGDLEGIMETMVSKFWSGHAPKPVDLVAQMDQPFQYMVESMQWYVDEIALTLSRDLVLLSPTLKRHADEPPVVTRASRYDQSAGG